MKYQKIGESGEKKRKKRKRRERREKEEKKKRKRRERKKEQSTNGEKKSRATDTEGVGTNSQRDRKGWTRKKRCVAKKERGSEGLWDEKEGGGLEGNGEEMG